MSKGYNRFEHFLVKLEELMQDAALSDDPANHIYANDGRGILFKLEALGRLYSELHNPGRFSKLTARFKLVEDLLGDVDHYDTFHKKFNGNNEFAGYFDQQKQEAMLTLNRLLSEDDWLNGKRIKKIRKKLEDADWMEEENELEAVQVFYKETIADVRKFYNDCEHPFRDMEDEVHELRRDLRWLSIYPHAMVDMFQLSEDEFLDSEMQIYNDPRIINSPFLNFPESKGRSIILNRTHFIALSWVIDQLGRIKDEGLEVFALKEAREKKVPDEYILREDEENYETIRKLLGEATSIANSYFSLKSPERLLYLK